MFRYAFLFVIIITFLKTSAALVIPEKILVVEVDEIGTITVNNDTVGSDMLARYIQERLFKSYAGTGKMHNRIKFEKATESVPEMVSEAVIKEINQGQKGALTELCIQKYRMTYDSLDKRQQDKLKKLYPVLFQLITP